MRPQPRSTRSRYAAEESALHDISTVTTKRPRAEASFQVYQDDTPQPSRKKTRHRMTDHQLERLEALYQYATHPTRQEKEALGDEVGMDARTVTVWFQNRRQLAKKASDTETKARPVQPTHREANLIPRRPLASVPLATNNQTKTPAVHIETFEVSHDVARKAWNHVQPMTGSVHEFNNLSTSETRSLGGMKIQTPDWTCDRNEKRGLIDIDSQRASSFGGDTTDDEVDIVTTDDDLPVKTSIASARRDIRIPPELRARFSADVVLGASLLLSFQRSAI
ncbi:unnamed protein product [Somion occarium]|uniref:Homeobox domain-containing protein n=1 Tax=Somion occarium TaxID=3059160 RepID=A0ABP1CH77_9APHY